MFREGTKPLVGAIHLAASLGYEKFPGHETALRGMQDDIDAMFRGGLDGVLLENENDKPHTLTIDKAAVAWLTRLALAARASTLLPLGINVQRIDWEATLAIAAAAKLDFIRLDVYVDRVKMQGEVVEVDPSAVLALRKRLGAEHVELWTDIHVKHSEILSSGSIGESAARAEKAGSAALLVTGARTGEPPSMEDLRAAKQGAPHRPVIIASGLNPENAARLAPHADGAVVGTSLKDGGRVSLEKTRALVAAWQIGCASQR